MKWIFKVGLLALPALLCSGLEARAQFGGHAGPIPPPGCAGAALPQRSTCAYIGGCGGFCFRFLGAIHSHGPLYNYGPYTGYYPFEPYGPWNSSLQYTGPNPYGHGACGWAGLFGHRCGLGGCGLGGCGVGGRLGLGGCGIGGRCGHGLLSHSCSTCSGWGGYARTTLSNIRCRLFPLCHRATGCDTGCETAGATCEGNVEMAAPVAPVAPPAAVQQTSYPRTER